MIKVYNNQNDTWTVYNHDTQESATIVRFHDTEAKRGFYYRVDFYGETRETMIDYFITARSEAMALIKSR